MDLFFVVVHRRYVRFFFGMAQLMQSTTTKNTRKSQSLSGLKDTIMASGNRNPSSTSTSTAKVNGNGNDVGGLVGSNLNEAEIDSYIKPDEPVIVVEKGKTIL